jgi:hypothetical protein
VLTVAQQPIPAPGVAASGCTRRKEAGVVLYPRRRSRRRSTNVVMRPVRSSLDVAGGRACVQVITRRRLRSRAKTAPPASRRRRTRRRRGIAPPPVGHLQAWHRCEAGGRPKLPWRESGAGVYGGCHWNTPPSWMSLPWRRSSPLGCRRPDRCRCGLLQRSSDRKDRTRRTSRAASGGRVPEGAQPGRTGSGVARR